MNIYSKKITLALLLQGGIITFLIAILIYYPIGMLKTFNECMAYYSNLTASQLSYAYMNYYNATHKGQVINETKAIKAEINGSIGQEGIIGVNGASVKQLIIANISNTTNQELSQNPDPGIQPSRDVLGIEYQFNETPEQYNRGSLQQFFCLKSSTPNGIVGNDPRNVRDYLYLAIGALAGFIVYYFYKTIRVIKQIKKEEADERRKKANSGPTDGTAGGSIETKQG